MKPIICIDNEYGMMFNNRRLSQDIKQRENLSVYLQNKTICMSTYSASLYEENLFNIKIISNINEAISEFVLIEDLPIASFIDADQIIIYNWNRSYPSDVHFDIKILASYTLIEQHDFSGNSHNLITRSIYLKNH